MYCRILYFLSLSYLRILREKNPYHEPDANLMWFDSGVALARQRERDRSGIYICRCVYFFSSIFAIALKIARLFGLCSVEINESWNVTRFSHFFVAFAELTMKNYSLNMLIQEFPAALDSTIWNHNK